MAKFEQKENINTTVEHVWTVLTDPKTWGAWFPGIAEATFDGPLQKGTQFQWRNGAESGAGTIIQMEVNNVLEIIIDEGKTTAHHRFNLRPTGGVLGIGARDAQLDYVLDTGGGMLDQFLRGGNPLDLKRMKDALAKIDDLSGRL